MSTEEMFTNCKYSIAELEQFRDEDGFINLDKINLDFSKESREIMGNPHRLKNWVNFNGKRVLIKGEAILDEQRNYGIYAELIVEEIAKELGIETAHYDLIKISGDEGKTIYGVLTECMVDLEKGERLESLNSIIGEDTVERSDYPDITDYYFTEEKLREQLKLDGIEEQEIEQLISEYKKRLVFGISVLNADQHTENIAFIRRKVNGKEEIRLSPNFDSESSLMLDNNISIIRDMVDNLGGLMDATNTYDPKIAIIENEDDLTEDNEELTETEDDLYEKLFNILFKETDSKNGPDVDKEPEQLWQKTLRILCEDEKVMEFYKQKLAKPIDMDSIFSNVEKRIGNKKIPEDIKLLAKYSYLSRFLFMECVLLGKKKPNEKIFLSKLLNMGIDDDISISEQVEVGKRLQGIIDLGQKYNLTNQGTTQQSDGYSQQDGELR